MKSARCGPPRGRRELRCIGRNGESDNGSRMTFDNLVWLQPARRPDGNLAVRTSRCHSSVPEEGSRVHCTGMEAKDLLGRLGCQGPSDRRSVEAPRQNCLAIDRNGDCADRSAVPRQLRLRGPQREKQRCRQNGGGETQGQIHWPSETLTAKHPPCYSARLLHHGQMPSRDVRRSFCEYLPWRVSGRQACPLGKTHPFDPAQWG